MEINKIKTRRIDNIRFSFINKAEFEAIYKDIFRLEEYKFSTKSKNPLIIDCGSHIGLTILYFKKLYPDSRIIGFEPNPMNFNLLQRNITQNKLKSIKLINTAVSDKEGKINFYINSESRQPWSWGDAAVKNKWYDPKKYKTIKVKSVRLSSYIDKNVDLIKLDIEGAELKVLKEIAVKLSLIRELIMEFHGSSTNPENDLEETLELLEKSGYTITIKYKGKERVLLWRKLTKLSDPYWLIIHAKKK